MSNNVKHINLRKSPLPRTGRELDAVGGTITSTPGGLGPSGGGSGEPINISINQGEGIEVTGSETSYTISHADTSDALNTENTDTSVITNVQIDKFGHVTGIESGDVTTELDGRYIRKDIPDTDYNHLTLAGGVKVENGATADTLNVEKTATTLNLIVKELASTYDLDVTHVATLFRTIIKDYISSSLFIPGFTGSGMKLYQALNGDWNLELDNLTVRKLFNVFELVIQKIRSINGALIISQANGTIESVTDAGDSWQLGFSEEYPVFTAGDLLRCQVFGGKNMKYYWVTVSSVAGSTVNVLKSEFEGVVPAVGDEVVQIGNDRDPARQSLIYLSASENGRPVIDVLSDVNSKSFAGKLKGRFGCLDDITDTDFPADYQPSGYGLYSTNAFLKGVFVLRNGKELETELAALNGEISLRVTKDEYHETLTGSRNLFLNTKEIDNPDIWEQYTGQSSVSWMDGFKVCLIYYNWGRVWQRDRFKPGKTYTLSCWIKRDPAREIGAGEPSRVQFVKGSLVEDVYTTIPDLGEVPLEWTRLIWTFKTSSNCTPEDLSFLPRLEFYCNDYQNNNPGVLIYGYMVVEGDKAASWAPAPEDVEKEYKEYTSSQILVAKGEIDLSVTTHINNIQIGTRNYLSNSRMRDLSSVNYLAGGTAQVVEDDHMGTVVEYSRPYLGGGDFQFAFTVNDFSMLKNTDLVYYVIAKDMGHDGLFYFGGWPETYAALDPSSSNKIDLGGGWYQHWRTFKSTDVGVGSGFPFGINTISGTWRFYAVGVLKGNKPASWSPAIEDMASKVELQSGIKILQDSVSTKVSQTTFDDLGRRVGTIQSQTIVNTQGIAQTVEKTNLATEIAIAMASGEMLYPDPTFEDGTNGIFVYNNSGNGNVVITRTNQIRDVPNRGGWALIIQTKGPATPYHGGFTFDVPPLANGVFVVRFIALIPVGCEIAFFTNNLGDNYKTTWLTSAAGTGDWQEYGIKIKYGTGNPLGSTAFFALDGPAYPTWYLSYATVFNVSNAPATATKTQIKQTNDRIDLTATEVNDLTGRVKRAEIALKPDNIWIGLKDNYGIATKQELLDTGIDITNRQIVVTADTFKVRSNTGQDIAVFKIGADGQPKIKAQNIDVDNLQVKMLDGATGSFKTLNCVNGYGQIVGKIQFGSDGAMWFDGNLYHQAGINTNPRFYMANAWVRGCLSVYMYGMMQVNDGAATYYINGYNVAGQWKGLESKISSTGVGYHPIPLVLTEGEGSGFSPEMILMNCNATRYYELVGLATKKVVVINVHKTVPVNIYANGRLINIPGGHLREFYCVTGFLNPAPSYGVLGAGWMVGAASATDF